MINQRITSNELNWIGLDWDETLCHNTGLPDFIPTELLPGAKEAVEKIVSMGFQPVVYTARPWSEFHLIRDKVKEYNLPIKMIICGKPLMRLIVDDRNVEFNGNWEEAINKIK